MTLFFPSPEFDDAVAAVCLGTATEEEMRALNNLLRSDRAALDEYIIRVELHSRLGSDPDLFLEREVSPLGCVVPEISRREFNLPARSQNRRTRRMAANILALAACLALVAGGVWRFWFGSGATGTTSKAVAMLAQEVDAQWGKSTEPPRVGGALEAGTLRLESGLAQIVFYSGARVVIEGPAELQLVSPTEAACPSGRLVAEVPGPARGFRLKTSEMDVVDLGTAFGINAMHDRSELHVFKGEVEFSSGTASMQPILEGRAVVVAGSAPPQFIAANQEAFTSMFNLQKRSLSSAAIRFDQWRVTSAWRNQDPSLLLHLDFDGLDPSAWTLQNVALESHSMQDATIIGCQRAEGRWPDKQALDFQSVNDRVRLTVPGSYTSVTLLAWVRIRGLDRQFNSLFMSDGFNPGGIHWLIRQDGVLGLSVKGAASGKSEIAASPPILTLDKFGMWTHLAVVIDGQNHKVVHYVNGVSVARHPLKTSPPFRLGAAELGNWNSESSANPTPSLIRNLSGSIDDFEVFSRALTDSEISELYAEGRPESEN